MPVLFHNTGLLSNPQWLDSVPGGQTFIIASILTTTFSFSYFPYQFIMHLFYFYFLHFHFLLFHSHYYCTNQLLWHWILIILVLIFLISTFTLAFHNTKQLSWNLLHQLFCCFWRHHDLQQTWQQNLPPQIFYIQKLEEPVSTFIKAWELSGPCSTKSKESSTALGMEFACLQLWEQNEHAQAPETLPQPCNNSTFMWNGTNCTPFTTVTLSVAA